MSRELKGLTTDARNVLLQTGMRSRDAALKAIQEGQIDPLKTPNLGPVLLAGDSPLAWPARP